MSALFQQIVGLSPQSIKLSVNNQLSSLFHVHVYNDSILPIICLPSTQQSLEPEKFDGPTFSMYVRTNDFIVDKNSMHIQMF